MIADLDADATMAAVYHWIKTEPKFPSMAELRTAVRLRLSREKQEEQRRELVERTGPIEIPEHVKEWQSQVGWA